MTEHLRAFRTKICEAINFAINMHVITTFDYVSQIKSGKEFILQVMP
jgi:hypothetical protein